MIVELNGVTITLVGSFHEVVGQGCVWSGTLDASPTWDPNELRGLLLKQEAMGGYVTGVELFAVPRLSQGMHVGLCVQKSCGPQVADHDWVDVARTECRQLRCTRCPMTAYRKVSQAKIRMHKQPRTRRSERGV